MYRPLASNVDYSGGRNRSLDDLYRGPVEQQQLQQQQQQSELFAPPTTRGVSQRQQQNIQGVFRTINNSNYDTLEHPLVQSRAVNAVPTYTVYTSAQLKEQRSGLIWTILITSILTVIGSLVSSIIFFHYQRTFELSYDKQRRKQREAQRRKRVQKPNPQGDEVNAMPVIAA